MLRGLVSAGLVPANHPLALSDFVIYTFHMPLFFLLAGMNARRSLAKGSFLSSKIATIIYPYFLWSLLQGSIQLLLSGSANHAITVDDLLSIPWKPTSQFWFLYAIYLCHVFIWLTRGDVVRIGIFALAAYPVGVYTVGSLGILSNALIFFMFYVLGSFIEPYLKNMVVRMTGSEGVALTTLAFVITVTVAAKMGGYYAPTALCTAFLGIFLVLQLSCLLPANAFGRAIEVLGQASMPIYLAHVLATAGVRILLLKLHVTNVPVHVVAGLVLGVLLPLVMYYVLYRLKWERWFGMSSGAAVFERRTTAAPVLAYPVRE
jgi:fucose 4-O-acetylase-like acetyltransferase